MKRFNLLLVAVVMYSFTSAQNKTAQSNEEKSKLETITLKTGALLKKEFIDAGTAGRVSVSILKITDFSTSTTTSGIKLEATVAKSYGTDTKSCFLDADEIDGLIKSGNHLLTNLSDQSENYTEYIFKSRDGFQAGAFQSKKEWKYFIQLDKYDSNSNVYMSKDDFKKMIDLIIAAKAKL